MTHWKQLFDPSEYLGPQDFQKPKKVTISRVTSEKGDDGKKRAHMYFIHEGKELTRKWNVPKSSMYGLSILLGSDYDSWHGKQITLHADHCLSFGDVEECVRCEFPPNIEERVIKYLKKRKVNPKVHRCPAPTK